MVHWYVKVICVVRYMENANYYFSIKLLLELYLDDFVDIENIFLPDCD